MSTEDQTILIEQGEPIVNTSEQSISGDSPCANPAPSFQSTEEVYLSLEKKAYLFNQFYFDLLKKLKTCAKAKKEKSKEARNILRSIKSFYNSYETGSVEYIDKFKESMTSEFWKQYYESPIESVYKLLLSEPAFDSYVYTNISVDMIAVCMDDTLIFHHYLTIFAILMQNITDGDATRSLTILKNMKNSDITKEFETIQNEDVRKCVSRLYGLYASQASNVFGKQFADIENTTLGKMAKEIMEDVDLSHLQNSFANNGDIFKVLADPNSGIGNLLGTVSQKMITKLASGDIKQENLLEDAMKFATKLPGLIPGGGNSGMDFGKMASMMQNIMGGGGNDASGGGSFDMGSLMNMMQGMMGGNKGKKSMAKDPRSSGLHSAAKNLSNNTRKAEQIKRMRDKMKKPTTKENIHDQVE